MTAVVANALEPTVVVVTGARHHLLRLRSRLTLFGIEGLDSSTLRTSFGGGRCTPSSTVYPPLLTPCALLLLVGRRPITLARTSADRIVLTRLEQLHFVVACVLIHLDSRLR